MPNEQSKKYYEKPDINMFSDLEIDYIDVSFNPDRTLSKSTENFSSDSTDGTGSTSAGGNQSTKEDEGLVLFFDHKKFEFLQMIKLYEESAKVNYIDKGEKGKDKGRTDFRE